MKCLPLPLKANNNSFKYRPPSEAWRATTDSCKSKRTHTSAGDSGSQDIIKCQTKNRRIHRRSVLCHVLSVQIFKLVSSRYAQDMSLVAASGHFFFVYFALASRILGPKGDCEAAIIVLSNKCTDEKLVRQ